MKKLILFLSLLSGSICYGAFKTNNITATGLDCTSKANAGKVTGGAGGVFVCADDVSGGGGSSSLSINKDGVQITSPTAQINIIGSSGLNVVANGSTATISMTNNLPGGGTSYWQYPSTGVFVNSFGLNSSTIILSNSIIIGTGTILPACPVSVFGSTDTYFQFNIQNQSGTSSASTDFVATANNGNDSTYYVNLGINGSGYSNGSYTSGGANDSYLLASNKSLGIITAENAATNAIKFFTAGTLSTNEKMRIGNDGKVGISTNAPAYLLDVKGAINSTTTISNIVQAGTVTAINVLVIPNTANPQVDSVGDFAIDSSSGQVVINNGVNTIVLPSTFSKSMNLESPASGDFPLGFRTHADITVTSLVCVSSAATSATISFLDCAGSDGTSCNTLWAGASCGTTEFNVGISSNVTAGRRIRPKVTATSGTPGWLGIDVYFREVRK